MDSYIHYGDFWTNDSKDLEEEMPSGLAATLSDISEYTDGYGVFIMVSAVVGA